MKLQRNYREINERNEVCRELVDLPRLKPFILDLSIYNIKIYARLFHQFYTDFTFSP